MVGSHPLHLRVFSNVPNTFCLLWSVFLSDRLTFKLKFLFRSKQWDKELWWNGSCPFITFKNFYIPTNIAFWLLSLSAIELTFSSKFLFWWNRNQELRWKGSCPFITFKSFYVPNKYCLLTILLVSNWVNLYIKVLILMKQKQRALVEGFSTNVRSSGGHFTWYCLTLVCILLINLFQLQRTEAYSYSYFLFMIFKYNEL